MSVLAEFIGGYDSLGSEQVRINNKGVRQVRRGGRWMKACRHRTGCDKSAEGSTDYCVKHGGGNVAAFLQKEVLDAMGSDGMGVPKCCAEGMVNVVKIGF